MPTRPIFDTNAVAVILKKDAEQYRTPHAWDNLCYCLLEAAWRTVADLVLYLSLLKSVTMRYMGLTFLSWPDVDICQTICGSPGV